MKSVGFVIAIIILATSLSPSVAQAQKTKTGYDKSVNFSNYKTFMFGKTAGARNPLVDQMIRTAVERELASKGLTKVETDADLKVVYLAGSGFNLEVAKVPFFTPVNPVYTGIMPGAAAMWDVTTGTLLIDLFDIKTDRVVFRGTIEEVLERAPSNDPVADAKLVSKPVNKGIAKIFKKYPKAVK